MNKMNENGQYFFECLRKEEADEVRVRANTDQKNQCFAG